MKMLFCISLCLVLGSAEASPYDLLIDRSARRHGVDPLVLRTIAAQESRKHPWTFNADGEGFHFDSKELAVNALWALTKRPWLAKVHPADKSKPIRLFFATQQAASAYIASFNQGRRSSGKSPVSVRTDKAKEVLKGQARVRKLWLFNTDIGIAQISYRFHGKNKATISQWFDPAFNLNYAAKHLADLKKRYGSDMTAAGYYHSKTYAVREKYLRDFRRNYEEERKAASSSTLASNR